MSDPTQPEPAERPADPANTAEPTSPAPEPDAPQAPSTTTPDEPAAAGYEAPAPYVAPAAYEPPAGYTAPPSYQAPAASGTPADTALPGATAPTEALPPAYDPPTYDAPTAPVDPAAQGYAAPTGYPGSPAAPAYGAPGAVPQPGTTPAYGAPGHGAPQPYAPAPPASGPDGRPKVLAIVGLALAVVGVVMAFIPFVTWFSGLFLLAGFVLGLIALISKKQGGKGFAIGAVAVSVVGWIVSAIVTIASFVMIGQATDDAIDQGRDSSITEPSEQPADEPPATTAQDLEIVESAFGRDSFGDSWWYVIILDNPNADHVFDLATLDVEAIGADGTILDSSTEFVTLLTGETALAGSFYAVGQAEIASLDVRGPGGDEAVSAPADETGSFAVADLSAVTDDYSTTVTGTLSGTFEEEQELVRVVVVARDATGAIIGGTFTYVDRLPNDGTKVQFSASFFEPMPEGAIFDIYPSL